MEELKRSKNKNFYLTIIESVKTSGKLPSLNISKQALNYYVSRLKKEGYIRRISYGVWRLEKEVKEVKIAPKDTQPPLYKGATFTSSALSRQDKYIRGHGFILKFKIPKVKRWAEREKYLKSKNINYDTLGFGGLTQQITFKGFKVWLATESIIIYTPRNVNYFDFSAKGSRRQAIKALLGLFQGLEKLLNVDLRFNDGYHFTVARQHYAKINDFFAEYMNKKGEKLSVRNGGGLWFIIDNSFNLNEAETVHKDTASRDMDEIISPFLNDLKAHHDKTGEVMTFSKILELFSGVAKNQQSISLREEMLTEQIRRLTEIIEARL